VKKGAEGTRTSWRVQTRNTIEELILKCIQRMGELEGEMKRDFKG
jgi:hypothetical protein